MIELLENPYIVKVLQSCVLMIVVYALLKIAILIATKGGKRHTEAPFAIKYTALFFFGFSLIFIWLEGLGSILTALTIVAAALTIVSKELILNFLGSFVIFWREIFSIGDRVQIGDFSGDVIDKGLLYFTLLEVGRASSTGHSTGRLIKVPNALALTLPVINGTRGAGYMWNEIKIAVMRGSDWKFGRQTLLDCVESYYGYETIELEKVRQFFEKKKIFFKVVTPRVYVSVSNGGIDLTLRYLCRSRLARDSEDFITTQFLEKLEVGKLELAEEQAYSTR